MGFDMWINSDVIEIGLCFSMPRFSNHEKSKKHKENVAFIKEQLAAEEEDLATPEDDLLGDEDEGEDAVIEDEEPVLCDNVENGNGDIDIDGLDDRLGGGLEGAEGEEEEEEDKPVRTK